MSRVSIVIPCYNPGPYLRQAVASVHAQTYDDWDLVVVDDASPQDVGWVPAEFPRARLVRQPHGGVSVARNRGVLSTAGEFVAFMDQDDLWRPDKLRRQVDALTRHPDAAVCHCDLTIITADDTLTSGDATDPATDPAELIELRADAGLLASVRHFSRRFVVPSTVLIRRSCLATSGLLDPFIPFSGDYDLLIKLGAAHAVVRVPAADALYRKHADNYSDRYDVGRREVAALTARYVALAHARGDRPLAREAPRLFARPRRVYAAQAFDCARRALRRRDRAAAAKHLSRAVRFSPAFVAGQLLSWAKERAK